MAFFVPDGFVDDLLSRPIRIDDFVKESPNPIVYGSTISGSTKAFNTALPDTKALVKGIMEASEKIKLVDNLRKSRAAFRVMEIPGCPHCGLKPTYKEEPELLTICECMFAKMKELILTINPLGDPVIISPEVLRIEGIQVQVVPPLEKAHGK